MGFVTLPKKLSKKPFSRSYLVAGFGLLGLAFLATIGLSFLFPYAYDDAYISYRITENFATSGYPFFTNGFPVYTNTSLIYPVWNALWFIALGSDWTNSISTVNGILQVLVLLRVAFLFYSKAANPSEWFLSCLSILPLALSGTQLATGNSGLETSFYQLVLAFSILPNSWKPLGWIAGFVRPEGFLMGLAQFISRIWDGKPWLNYMVWGIFIFSGWLCLSIFWFGTPIPQSILAKSNYEFSRLEQIQNGYKYLFLQGYGFYSLLIGSALFAFPRLRGEFRVMLIWLGIYVLFFSLLASWWAWYVPPVLVPIQYMAGRSVMEWWASPNFQFKNNTAATAALITTFFVFTCWEFSLAYERKKSESMAFLVRLQSSKKIGAWLSNHVKNQEEVLMEPLGLIGYHSPKVSFLDYPGLSRPEVSKFLHNLEWKIPIQLTDSRTDSAILAHFKPQWLVLFPYEIPAFKQIAGFDFRYQKVDSLAYYPLSERFRQAVIFKKTESILP